MKRNQHIDKFLDAYIDNEIPSSLRVSLDAHVDSCDRCRGMLAKARQQLSDIQRLPASIVPPVDLWPSIEKKLAEKQPTKIRLANAEYPESDRMVASGLIWNRIPGWAIRIAAVLAFALVGSALFFLLFQRHESPWHVTAIEGNPRIGGSRVALKTKLNVGDWITTDAQSRARIGIDSIGQIDVASGTALRFVEANDRRRLFSLAVGEIHAKVNAPPRLFVVETPTVRAVDLGCDYTLHADSSGECTLQVFYGWVELASGNRRSEVPAGFVCLTRSGFGPGTPYSTGSSDTLQHSLARFDFENGGPPALRAILAAARPSDALTLWHLLFRVESGDRSDVYDRLAALIKPPRNVTRPGFLAGDSSMIMAWQERLDLDQDATWHF